MNTVLVADDEKEIVELIELYLSKENITVLKAYNGLEALEIIKKEDISLGIIDIMMPEINGFNVIKKIREDYSIPLLILSAKDSFEDKILGLGIGADDYITKPFNPLELTARVQAQLRRYYKLNQNNITDKNESGKITLGELELDKNSCELKKKGVPLTLTTTEYKIFVYLSNNPGRVFTKRQIYENVWEDEYCYDDNTVRIHVSNLRDKIEDDSKNPKYLKTVRGLGYKIELL